MGLVAAGTPLLAAPVPTKGGTGRPQFFNVMDFGVTGDGTALDSGAINSAINACNAAGGGMVYVPPGTYLCGTVVLKSNVTLYLEAGATLLGSKKISDYTPFAGPSADGDANQKHLLFARDAENIGLAGLEKIDGQGASYWTFDGRHPRPPEDGWRDSAAHGWKHALRPSPMVEFYNCKNLHIEDVRIENSSGWTLRPIHCDNVFIRGISIKNPVYGPNTDGIDATCCHNVFISDCLIDTGDDAICLKSENPYGEELRASKNITVTNCVLTGCCNGFKFGTATHGAYENIVFSNSVIYNDDVPLGSRIIAGVALEMVDGGSMEGVLISNIRMQRVRTPIFIRRGNRRPRPDGTPGTLRGIMIENVHATGAILTSSITGLPGFDVEDVTLSNIRIDSEENGTADLVSRKIPETEKAYPEAREFGKLPAYGFYCRHVTGLRLRNIEFRASDKEERPAIFCEDVKNLDINGLRSQPIVGSQPVVKLVQSKQVFLQNCSPSAETKTFLEVSGGNSESIVLNSNNLLGAEQAVLTASDVSPAAVTASGNVVKT